MQASKFEREQSAGLIAVDQLFGGVNPEPGEGGNCERDDHGDERGGVTAAELHKVAEYDRRNEAASLSGSIHCARYRASVLWSDINADRKGGWLNESDSRIGKGQANERCVGVRNKSAGRHGRGTESPANRARDSATPF